MVLQVMNDGRLELYSMSGDDDSTLAERKQQHQQHQQQQHVDSPKSTSSPKMSSLRTKSSKRSCAYSNDQVQQLIDLFPEISHLKKRADSEHMAGLFPEALAELVEILGTTKKVEQELFRRKEAREKEAKRVAEKEVRKNTGVRFATAAANENRVFECLESEALRRAGIAEQALANAKTARDKVHKLYKGLLSTTNPVAEDDSRGLLDEVSISHSTLSAVDAQIQQQKKQQQKEQELPSQQKPMDELAPNLGKVSAERWGALRSEARVIITRRLLVGWKMTSKACHGSECNHCPLLTKQKKAQCVVCGGSGSGNDGMYGSIGNSSRHHQHRSDSKATKEARSIASSSKSAAGSAAAASQQEHAHEQQNTKLPLIEEVSTASIRSQALDNSPSHALGQLHHPQHHVSHHYQPGNKENVEEEKMVLEETADSEDDDGVEVRDEFEYLLSQQRSENFENENHKSVAVYQLETGSGSIVEEEEDQIQQLAEDDPVEEQYEDAEDGVVELDEQQKQEILDEVKSFISQASSRKAGLRKDISTVGKEILLKTAEGWSLIDASCGKCEMPLLIDPSGAKELCVFCTVAREPEIYLDRDRDTPSEMTDTLFSKHNHRCKRDTTRSMASSARQPPASVTVKITEETGLDRNADTGDLVEHTMGNEEDMALRAVASPGFDEHDMFPFLKEKEEERRLAASQQSRTGSFAGSAETRSFMGILPRENGHHHSTQQQQPQTHRGEAPHYDSHHSSHSSHPLRREPYGPAEQGDHHIRRKSNDQIVTGKLHQDRSVYEKAKQRIQQKQISAASLYTSPYGDQISSDRNMGYDRTMPATMQDPTAPSSGFHDRHSYSEQCWQPLHQQAYAPHTEARKSPQYRLHGDENREEPPMGAQMLPQIFTGAPQEYTPQGVQSPQMARGTMHHFEEEAPTQAANREMKMRVTENIKIERMQGHKRIRTSLESPATASHLSPQHTLPVSKIEPNGLPRANLDFQPDVMQSISPRHASNTFYVQLQRQKPSGTWPSSAQDQTARQDIGQTQNMDLGRPLDGILKNAETTARPSNLSSSARTHPQSQTSTTNQTPLDSLPAQICMTPELASPSRGSLPRAQENTNDVSENPASFSEEEPAESKHVPRKDIASLVSSLGLPGVEESNHHTTRSATPSTEPLQTERALEDELSGASPVEAGKSSSSRASSESLITSIRLPFNVRDTSGQDCREDPPDAPFNVGDRGSRAGMDPEEGMPLASPEKAKPVSSPADSHRLQRVSLPKSKGQGGYSIVVPDDFDFDDEAKLRELVLAARQQQRRKQKKGTRAPKDTSTQEPPILHNTSKDTSTQEPPILHNFSKEEPSLLPRSCKSPERKSPKRAKHQGNFHTEDENAHVLQSPAPIEDSSPHGHGIAPPLVESSTEDERIVIVSHEITGDGSPKSIAVVSNQQLDPSTTSPEPETQPLTKCDEVNKSTWGYLDLLINSIKVPARAGAKFEGSKDGRSDPPACAENAQGNIRVSRDPDTDVEVDYLDREPEELPATGEAVASSEPDAESEGVLDARPQSELVRAKPPTVIRDRKKSPKPESFVVRRASQQETTRKRPDEHAIDPFMLAPRVQSPYFEGISDLERGPDLSIPSAPSAPLRARRGPAPGAMLASSKNRRHSSAAEGDHRQLKHPSRTTQSSGRFSLGGQGDHQKPRAPSFGEDEPSQRERLFSPTNIEENQFGRSLSSTDRSRAKHFKPRTERESGGGGSLGCTSSLSSWTTEISRISKVSRTAKNVQKRRVKPSAERERRLSDTLRFDPNAKATGVASSNSSVSSFSSTRRDKRAFLAQAAPPRRAPVPAPELRASKTQSSLGKLKTQTSHSFGSYSSWTTNKREDASISRKTSQEEEMLFASGQADPIRRAPVPEPDQRASKMQSSLGKLKTRTSRSFGSYSSWATNDRTEHSKGASREDASISHKTSQEEDMHFVGGPLDKNPPTEVLSPASTGSNSTPFEDILNRCKFKLEQLSLPDDESSRPGKHLFSLASGSQPIVIDLVHSELDDE